MMTNMYELATMLQLNNVMIKTSVSDMLICLVLLMCREFLVGTELGVCTDAAWCN